MQAALDGGGGGGVSGGCGEPPLVVECVVRCPDGSRCAAPLPAGAPLAALFALVEARWVEAPGAPQLPPDFALATTFPRRRIARPAAAGEEPPTTLRDAGLADSRQQMFLVEM